MAQNQVNTTANRQNPQSRSSHSFNPPVMQRPDGLAPMPPRRPSLDGMPTRQRQPSNGSHTKSSVQVQRETIMKARMAIHAKNQALTAATVGSSKGEDHEPNLENLRRINRPPAVISTAPPIPRSRPARRQSDIHHFAGHSGPRQKKKGRGRGTTHSRVATRENGHSGFSRILDQHRNPDEGILARVNTPKHVVYPPRNDEEFNSDMEIDEIDAFSDHPSSSTSKSHTFVEAPANSSYPGKFGTTSFLPRNVSRSAKYLSSISNLSDDHQTPIPPFSNPQPREIPQPVATDSSDRVIYFQKVGTTTRPPPSLATPSRLLHGSSRDNTPPKRSQTTRAEGLKRPLDLPAQSDDQGAPPKRKRTSALADSGIKSLFKRYSSPETDSVDHPPPHPRILQRFSDFFEIMPADCSGMNINQTLPDHGEQGKCSDGHDEHLDHVIFDQSQQDCHSLKFARGDPSEATSQPSRTAEKALTPPFSFSVSKGPPPQSAERSDPIVKEEPSPSRPASPIDVDASPLSLYDQLGLPNRTSGALRVPRPRFGKDEKAKKESWSKEVAESIRWVRGREGTVPPLIIGNIFWRPDGVSFDWTIPPDELIPEGPSSRAVDSAFRPSQIDTASESRSPDSRMAQIGGQQATAQDSIITTPTPVTRRAESIIVKEEVPEIYFLPSEPPMASSSQTDATSPRHIESPPRTAHSSDITEAHPLNSSRISQIPYSYNTSTPLSPVTPPPLFTNPAFESPDALSNIATCFLDRYTRCFDHVKSRGKLSEAYTKDAFMSLQFNDLPTEGSCPRVGQPRKQSHTIVNYADREAARNLLLDSGREPNNRQYKWKTKMSLAIGSQSIASRLATFEALSHTPSPSSSRSYQFVVTPIKELGLLTLEYSGELYATKANSEERYVSLRFHRTFVMRPNEPDAASWIDWPWVITNDQMTIFHRPGIMCQCPP